MSRKIVLIFCVILIAIAGVLLIWSRPAQGFGIDVSGEDQTVRDTILKARRIQLEAQYTFDTSQFATVYINDPRGGEITDRALALIREMRQDPNIQADSELVLVKVDGQWYIAESKLLGLAP